MKKPQWGFAPELLPAVPGNRAFPGKQVLSPTLHLKARAAQAGGYHQPLILNRSPQGGRQAPRPDSGRSDARQRTTTSL
jgi:hypothetical protein